MAAMRMIPGLDVEVMYREMASSSRERIASTSVSLSSLPRSGLGRISICGGGGCTGDWFPVVDVGFCREDGKVFFRQSPLNTFKVT